MQESAALVITSIASPNDVLKEFALGALRHGIQFIVIGDRASPASFQLDGCEFYSLEAQKDLDFRLAKILPERHYARKNLGYLLAIRSQAEIIVESDDDNFPLEDFWLDRTCQQQVPTFEQQGWLNVYAHFSRELIWPRGYPIEYLHQPVPPLSSADFRWVNCPIQQGLADENPDVDAIFRLTRKLPLSFVTGEKIALGRETWCPFNSQNTTFFRAAFPLLYLPSYCSFRMTDIWRSFVAQRILWENDWQLLFEQPTVRQDRNEHNLLKDFQDEIPGYLNNAKLCEQLMVLSLKQGVENLFDNLWNCYDLLVRIQLIGSAEMPLLEAWIQDLEGLIKDH